MIIRNYRPDDCTDILKLFYDTVHTVNSKDYTFEQISAWATGKEDWEEWNRSFLSHYTLVAEIEGVIVGFGDICEEGLDRIYVHKDYQRNGIATEICDRLEKNFDRIRTHSSITAKPFFESRGYKVVKRQSVVRKGVSLENFVMEKKK